MPEYHACMCARWRFPFFSGFILIRMPLIIASVAILYALSLDVAVLFFPTPHIIPHICAAVVDEAGRGNCRAPRFM